MCRLTTLFLSEFFEEHAEELGVVERDGKLQIPVLVWAFVSASPQVRAEHSLVSDAATIPQRTRRSLRRLLPPVDADTR